MELPPSPAHAWHTRARSKARPGPPGPPRLSLPGVTASSRARINPQQSATQQPATAHNATARNSLQLPVPGPALNRNSPQRNSPQQPVPRPVRQGRAAPPRAAAPDSVATPGGLG
jgi:hypothetical protein